MTKRAILGALMVAACLGTSCAAATRPGFATLNLEQTTQLEVIDAFALLQSEGPQRFAMVSPRLYRGGEPSPRDLARLRALGVTRIIDLRREKIGARRAARAVARRLGMELIEYPFYGVFGADPNFVDGVLGELALDDGGAVYLHCGDGRDRTGLMVALHRVVTQGWDPERAWEQEVLAYGHRPSLIRREIALTFRDHVHDHEMRMRAVQDGPARRSAATALRDVDGGREARHASHRAPSGTLDRSSGTRRGATPRASSG